MFEYMTVQEASKKWGISERRIQKLCSEERVPDLMKVGRMWLIISGSLEMRKSPLINADALERKNNYGK